MRSVRRKTPKAKRSLSRRFKNYHREVVFGGRGRVGRKEGPEREGGGEGGREGGMMGGK